jgi:hypothetical protein
MAIHALEIGQETMGTLACGLMTPCGFEVSECGTGNGGFAWGGRGWVFL